MTDQYPDAQGPGLTPCDTTRRSSSMASSLTINGATACRRCRKQKSRCSRELPSCKRCQRTSEICFYPAPPERKVLAAQRMQAKARSSQVSGNSPRQQQDHSPTGIGPTASQNSLRSPSYRSETHQSNRLSPEEQHVLLQPALPIQLTLFSTLMKGSADKVASPSPEISMLLIDIYFKRVYNAPLLFHKSTFVSDYIHHKLPEHVSLSVFALASVYLRESSHLPHLKESCAELGITISSVLECASHGYHFATAATQMFLMQADLPCIESIQTCQNLGLFWFSVGQTGRTHMHAHMAYRMCRLLGFHNPPDTNAEAAVLSAEIERRCFWACWITNCLSQGNATFKSESWEEAVGLPLPSDEASFLAGKPESKEIFSARGDLILLDVSNTKVIRPSIMGEIVKIFSLWWDIQHFVRRYAERSPGNSLRRVSVLLALDRRLELFHENLHCDLAYHGSSSFTAAKTDPYRLYWLHIMYHLCACILHSTNVPAFSRIDHDAQISKKLVRLSAEEAVKHSAIMVDLATSLFQIQPDISRLPSIIGYAMFVASWVQFKSLEAQGQLSSQGMGHCRAAISLLDQLKQYWKPLGGLWSALDAVLQSGQISLRNLGSGESPNSVLINIDQIVTHAPDSETSPDLYTYVEEHEPKPQPNPDQQLPPEPHVAETQTAQSLEILASQRAEIVSQDVDEYSLTQRLGYQSEGRSNTNKGQSSSNHGAQSNYPSTSSAPLKSQQLNELNLTNSFPGRDQNRHKQQYDRRQVVNQNAASNVEGSQSWWDQDTNGVSIADPFGFLAQDLLQVEVGW